MRQQSIEEMLLAEAALHESRRNNQWSMDERMLYATTALVHAQLATAHATLELSKND